MHVYHIYTCKGHAKFFALGALYKLLALLNVLLELGECFLDERLLFRRDRTKRVNLLNPF
jgi:hypothetical protein